MTALPSEETSPSAHIHSKILDLDYHAERLDGRLDSNVVDNGFSKVDRGERRSHNLFRSSMAERCGLNSGE